MAGEDLLAIHTKQFIFELSGRKKIGKRWHYEVKLKYSVPRPILLPT